MLACVCYQALKFELRRNKTTTVKELLNATNVLLHTLNIEAADSSIS